MRSDHDRADLDALKCGLSDRAEELGRYLFGEPSQRSARELRWGRKGAISVKLGRIALFKDHESDEPGGSLLDAIMFAQSCGFAEAVQWSRQWLGDDVVAQPRPVLRHAVPPAVDVDQVQREAAERAQRIWRAGRPIAKTAAARYLERRALFGDFPASVVRFVAARDVAADPAFRWWRWCAIVFPLTDDSGAVRAVQLVALNDDGSPAPHWEHGGKIKITRGPAKGHAIRFPGPTDGPVLLAEGPETAMSLWLATDLEVWAIAGGIGRAPLDSVPVGRGIVACRDDDPIGSPAWKAVRKAVRGWRRTGRMVVEALPWALARRDRSDFNDALCSDPLPLAGRAAVKARIDAALTAQPAVVRMPLAEARARLDSVVSDRVEMLRSWHGETDEPPFEVLGVGVGVGKTAAALRQVVSAAGQGDRSAYAMPTHKLGAELVQRAQREAERQGVSVSFAVWRGTAATNPETGKPMCERQDLLGEARAALADPKATVCKTCPKRTGCAYLAQFGQRAQVWFVPHALLFHRTPEPIGNLDWSVIDEGFALDGLEGVGGHALRIAREDLDAPPEHGNGRETDTADLQAALMPARRRLLAVLDGAPAGFLHRDRVLAAGFNGDECRVLHDLEWKRLMHPPAGIEHDAKAMRAALQRAKGNVAVRHMAIMWREAGELVAEDGPARAGRLRVERGDEAFMSLRLSEARRIRKGWRVPTLHIDATPSMKLLRARVGKRAQLAATIEAEAPHQHIRQIVGPFGKGSDKGGLLAKDGRLLGKVWAAIVADVRRLGGRWLVVANQAVEDRIRAKLAVPPIVTLAHFNALRGVDEYREVRGLVILGRPMPSPEAVEAIRATVTGRAPVAVVDGYYPARIALLTAKDGTRRTVEREGHPDPLCDEIVAQSAAELLQAIGRGRGVNRTAANPLDVVIYGNSPVPGIELDTIEDWQPPTFEARETARLGIELPDSAGDAAILLGVDRRRIHKARDRGIGGRSLSPVSNDYLSYDAGDKLIGYYCRQRTGRGASLYHRVDFDPRTVPDLKMALAPLGALKALHDPTDPDWGVVRCQVTGALNFSPFENRR